MRCDPTDFGPFGAESDQNPSNDGRKFRERNFQTRRSGPPAAAEALRRRSSGARTGAFRAAIPVRPDLPRVRRVALGQDIAVAPHRPCDRSRRADERDSPNAAPSTAGRCACPAAISTTGMSSGISLRRRPSRTMPPPDRRQLHRGSARRSVVRGRAWHRAAPGPPASARRGAVVVLRHGRVRDREQLPVHLLGGVADADLVPERLAHLPLAIEPGRIGTVSTDCCRIP